ncbi:AMP-binding protein [Dysgonomonas macrotermitis]|uniref:Long-chain acyl-CoA synthetase n=1 Tax=Dysgonomonas macrotermitis TaxID=1346286 RepID=A0A1M5DSS4_9BACT|nr:AMP-binding protein [Dysgonomonas macrotermitis]SHF69891.1 long-chain acyl-CoA synthetase [Dysgonomonas macrotermitis]
MIKENFIKLYENSFKYNWDLPALTDYGTDRTLFYKDLASEIARMHVLFEKLGVDKGTKISLVGKNTTNWCIAYMAVITYGGVIVPILQDFHADNIQHIINHSESEFLFVGDSNFQALDEDTMPGLKAIFSLTDFSCIHEKQQESVKKISGNLEASVTLKYPDGFQASDIEYADVDNSEVVLINYTSGTTGFSKGVMLMANNLAGNVVYAKKLDLLFRKQRVVSFLPLAHAYGCAFDFLYALSEGVHTTLLGKTPSPKILSAAFAEIRPNLIVSVPLVIEKIYKKALVPKLEKPAVKFALKVPLLRKRVYAKIRKGLIDALGGQFHEVIIGGAALNKEVESFLHKIKFPFTVGYGMTECGPLISYDHHYDFIPTSCGKILSIMEVRVDSTDPYNQLGEIQVRGENVMKGYYKNPEATQHAFTEDGWLRTGDLGTIDKDNRIYLRGRSKSMILGPSGQNIFPEEIEAKLNNLPYIMESVVVSRDNKLVALIYPDYEAIDAGNVSTKDLELIMAENKKLLNNSLASFESISAIHIYPTEFEKTPKKSIKRYLYEK